jgi:hypothetical protein
LTKAGFIQSIFHEQASRNDEGAQAASHSCSGLRAPFAQFGRGIFSDDGESKRIFDEKRRVEWLIGRTMQCCVFGSPTALICVQERLFV